MSRGLEEREDERVRRGGEGGNVVERAADKKE